MYYQNKLENTNLYFVGIKIVIKKKTIISNIFMYFQEYKTNFDK